MKTQEREWRHYIEVVSFTHRPLYPQGKHPSYQLDRRLGGSLSRSRSCEENSCHAGNQNPGLPARSPSLYQLSYPVWYISIWHIYFFSEKLGVEAHAFPLSTPSSSADAHMHLCWITVAERFKKRTALEQT
jgi:hypothetical protein